MARVIWTEPALLDLDEIAEYIALDDPLAACKYVQRLFDSVEEDIVYILYIMRSERLLRKSGDREHAGSGKNAIFYEKTPILPQNGRLILKNNQKMAKKMKFYPFQALFCKKSRIFCQKNPFSVPLFSLLYLLHDPVSDSKE